MNGWLILAAIPLIIFGVAAIHFYNRFKVLENRCDESWSNVGTELKRRHELIPNLVRTVQGYAAHEKSVNEDITEARALQSKVDLQPREAQDVEARLGPAMSRLLAVAEAYPELKASRSFLKLQDQLAETEDRIQAARRFYNGNVRDHRDATRPFPGNLFAKWFKPREQEFFEVDPVALPSVAVDF